MATQEQITEAMETDFDGYPLDCIIGDLLDLRAENEKLKNEMQKYIYVATMADCFVGLKPEHRLYESIRRDLKSSIKALKGGPK